MLYRRNNAEGGIKEDARDDALRYATLCITKPLQNRVGVESKSKKFVTLRKVEDGDRRQGYRYPSRQLMGDAEGSVDRSGLRRMPTPQREWALLPHLIRGSRKSGLHIASSAANPQSQTGCHAAFPSLSATSHI